MGPNQRAHPREAHLAAMDMAGQHKVGGKGQPISQMG